MFTNPDTEMIVLTERTELTESLRALNDLQENGTVPAEQTRLVRILTGVILLDLGEYDLIDEFSEPFVETYTGEEARLIKQALHRRRTGFEADSWEYAQITDMLGEPIPDLISTRWAELQKPRHNNLSLGPPPGLADSANPNTTGEFPVIYPGRAA